jgi:hypothetical protein
MTHSNHRQGTVDSLNKDYVVFMYAASGINDQDAGPCLQEFLRLALEHEPVNIGSPRVGNIYTASPQEMIERLADKKKIYVTFAERLKAEAFVKEVAKADLGISVVVSGLFNEVDNMCQAAGIKRHTAQCSLGVWGKTEKLPEGEILDITTMCGHGMISFNLVRRMVQDIRKGLINLEQAAGILARPCVCGIFNPKRAEEILQQCIDRGIGE